jgi:hypothetical protein
MKGKSKSQNHYQRASMKRSATKADVKSKLTDPHGRHACLQTSHFIPHFYKADMQWTEHIQSPVDWDPAWNDWVGLPETPRSARPIQAVDTNKKGIEENDNIVPDAIEYQQLVLSKVGEMEHYRPPLQRPKGQQAHHRPSENIIQDSDEHMKAPKSAAKPAKKRATMQQVRKAALINSRPMILQTPPKRHTDVEGQNEKARMHRSKGRVYGGSADSTGLERRLNR